MGASTPLTSLTLALIQLAAGPTLFHSPLQPVESQMSCRHLKYRAARTVESLGFSSEAQVSFVRLRDGYPVGRLVHEPVFRVHYAVTDPALWDAVHKAQTVVIWGAGTFDVRTPNGTFGESRFDDGSGLDFDVEAADVCYGAEIHIAFLSDCPLDSLRFDVCDHDAPSCLPLDAWRSPQYVTDWWKCGVTTRVDFDLSALAQELGKRAP